MSGQDRCVRNSMADHIDAGYLLSQIQLLRDEHQGAFLLVEGDTDQLVYERFIDTNACQIIITYGRKNALEVLELLASVPRASLSGVLAILDADFAHLQATTSHPQILLTDSHDLETLLISSPALEKLLREYGSEAKIATFITNHGEVRAHLLKHAAPLGYLLWHSLRQGLNLRFAELNFGRFVDERTLTLHPPTMIQAVLNHSQSPQHKVDDLRQACSALQDSAHDLLQVCSGHHLVELLAIGLRKALGTHSAQEVKPESLARSLRLAYEEHFFLSTKLHQSLAAWQALHPPFTVLRAPLFAGARGAATKEPHGGDPTS